MSSKPRLPVDDVKLEISSDPQRPSVNQVFILNSNSEFGTVATLQCESGSNFEITTLDNSVTSEYFPHQFQTRVPAGGTRFVGFDVLLSGSSGNQPSQPIPEYKASYRIVGADYVPNPFQPDPLPEASEIIDYVYQWKTNGQIAMVSKAHLWFAGVEIIFDNGLQAGYPLIPMEVRAGALWNIRRYFDARFDIFNG